MNKGLRRPLKKRGVISREPRVRSYNDFRSILSYTVGS